MFSGSICPWSWVILGWQNPLVLGFASGENSPIWREWKSTMRSHGPRRGCILSEVDFSGIFSEAHSGSILEFALALDKLTSRSSRLGAVAFFEEFLDALDISSTLLF